MGGGQEEERGSCATMERAGVGERARVGCGAFKVKTAASIYSASGYCPFKIKLNT